MANPTGPRTAGAISSRRNRTPQHARNRTPPHSPSPSASESDGRKLVASRHFPPHRRGQPEDAPLRPCQRLSGRVLLRRQQLQTQVQISSYLILVTRAVCPFFHLMGWTCRLGYLNFKFYLNRTSKLKNSRILAAFVRRQEVKAAAGVLESNVRGRGPV